MLPSGNWMLPSGRRMEPFGRLKSRPKSFFLGIWNMPKAGMRQSGYESAAVFGVGTTYKVTYNPNRDGSLDADVVIHVERVYPWRELGELKVGARAVKTGP